MEQIKPPHLHTQPKKEKENVTQPPPPLSPPPLRLHHRLFCKLPS